ncbi:9960_t:CDS:1, partial [Ambispora gerdemannii]
IYNQQDYSNDFTTTIYNQQDYTNDLAQNSLDDVFNNDKLNHKDNDNQLSILFEDEFFFAESGESYVIDTNNDSIDTFSAPKTSNTPITSQIFSPLTQSLTQIFMTKYDSCHF